MTFAASLPVNVGLHFHIGSLSILGLEEFGRALALMAGCTLRFLRPLFLLRIIFIRLSLPQVGVVIQRHLPRTQLPVLILFFLLEGEGFRDLGLLSRLFRDLFLFLRRPGETIIQHYWGGQE